jgi:hypothetical protein
VMRVYRGYIYFVDPELTVVDLHEIYHLQGSVANSKTKSPELAT